MFQYQGQGWFARMRPNLSAKDVSAELLWRVWRFAQPYRWKVLGLLATIFVISSLSLIPPLLFRDLIDNALPNRDGTRLNWLALGMILVPLANGLAGVIQRVLSSQVGEGVIFDLRRDLYTHMQRMSLRFFTETRTGELMSRMNNDVVGAQSAVTGTLINIASNVVSVIVTLLIMLQLEWRLTLLALLVVPLFVIAARRVAGVLRDLRRQSMEVNAEMNALMNETLNVSGALLVKLFGRTSTETDKFSSRAAEVRDIGIRSAVIGRWFVLFLSFASAAGTALVFWLGGRLVLADTSGFTIGTVVALGTYVRQLYGPLMGLTNAPVQFAQSMVSFERVFEALDIEVEIEEKADATELSNIAGQIEFRDLYFKYQGDDPAGLDEVERFSWRSSDAKLRRGKQREDGSAQMVQRISDRQYALENINCVLEPGSLVAIVGPSGAGKTTYTYMIPRLYDPTDGQVLIDGHDIRNVTLDSLADSIGMVTQETYLFYDTIRANLLYANGGANDAQLVAAAKAANIYDFIMSLPDGFDTVVGERGYRLSGGERQRIAIARVILKNPRILVLDEATSSLDSLSEALIQEALGRVMEGRTSLVIAHRLSTILSADKILVIDQGRLAEQGTHAELLAQDGLYADLYHTQFKPVPQQIEEDVNASF